MPILFPHPTRPVCTAGFVLKSLMTSSKCPFRSFCVWLTGYGEGDLLRPEPCLVLGHAGVGAWISRLCGTEDQIQAFLVHSALCGHPLSSSLPPHLGLRSAAWGTTGHPLQGVRCEDLRHLGHHVVYLCSGEQGRIWIMKLISSYTRALIIISLQSHWSIRLDFELHEQPRVRFIPTYSSVNGLPVLLGKVLWFVAKATVIREQSAQ